MKAFLCAFFGFFCVEQVVDIATVKDPIIIEEPVKESRIDLNLIPEKARPYSEFLLAAKNPSREAAQTHQESAWRPMAQSPYAKGLRQFTDKTGRGMSLGLCKDLGPYRPFDPAWSMTCGIRYQESLENNKQDSYCENRKIGEMKYNAGWWVIWETKHAGNILEAEKICGKVVLYNGRKRSLPNCHENYNYPRHIDKHQSKYMELGGQYCG